MSFPYIFAANFENGDNSEWDSESDGGSPAILDFPHYSTLANMPGSNFTPYSGAYCARLTNVGGTTKGTLTEGDINIANTVTNSFRFDILFGNDFTFTANDTCTLLDLIGTATTGAVGFQVVAATDVINMGIGSAATGTVPSQFSALQLQRNTWYTIEATFNIQTGGSGTADLFVTKAGDAAQTTADASLTSVTNVAVTSGEFGLQNQAATTRGTILLDNFVQDDTRIFPDKRFSREPEITKSAHVFVGPGSIDAAALLTSAGSNVMKLWDTDNADTNGDFKVELDQDRNTSFTGPLFFQKGCYAQISGTDPRGQVIFQGTSLTDGHTAPVHHSPANMRRWGQARKTI